MLVLFPLSTLLILAPGLTVSGVKLFFMLPDDVVLS